MPSSGWPQGHGPQREVRATRTDRATNGRILGFVTPAEMNFGSAKTTDGQDVSPTTEPAFEGMRKAFMIAVAKKDKAALMNLVGPTFLWTYDDEIADSFDFGRDAAHNFKVAFG